MSGQDLGPQPSDQGPSKADVLRQHMLEGGRVPSTIHRQVMRDTEPVDMGAIGNLIDSVFTAGGIAPSIGKGIVDAGLGLMHGAAWVGSLGQYDTSKLPSTIYDLLPEKQANYLSSRIARANIFGADSVLGKDVSEIGEVTGQILPLLGGGAIAGATGKGMANLSSRGLASKLLGQKAGQAVSKVIDPAISIGGKSMSGPGKAIHALSWPGAKIGQSLARVPRIEGWTRTANALPEIIGGATGFGLYNLATQDGDMKERGAAALHGLAAGAALAATGMAAKWTEARLLSKGLSRAGARGTAEAESAALKAGGMTGQRASERAAMSRMAQFVSDTRRGILPKTYDAFATKVTPKVAGVAIENTGFAMLDREFWDALLSGDTEKALGQYVATLPAALLARTGRDDAWREFRREAAEINDLSIRREMRDIINTGRDALDPSKLPNLEVQDPKKPASKEVEVKGVDETIRQADKQYEEPGISTKNLQFGGANNFPSGATVDPLIEATRPLFHSGWEISQKRSPDGAVRIALDGTPGDVLFKSGSGESGWVVSVPRSIYRTVRGEVPPEAAVEGVQDPARKARDSELDSAQQWADRIIEGSGADARGFAKQEIELDIDVDQARALVSHAPEGSILQSHLRDIVEAEAPYGPVTASGLEIASAIKSFGKKGGRSPNSKRVNEWLNMAAEEAHRWAKVEQYGSDSLAGKFAEAAPRLPIGSPSGKDAVILEGPVGLEFVNDLAAMSMLRRMAAEVRLGPEKWAGGPRTGVDGGMQVIGLDGQIYSREFPPSRNKPWVVSKEPEQPWTVSAEATPVLERWRKMTDAVRMTSSSNPGIDLMEVAVTTAINGRANSPSVQELRVFFDQVDPDQLAEALTPQNLEDIGHVIGKIGAGHSTAQNGMKELALALAKPRDFDMSGQNPEPARREPVKPEMKAEVRPEGKPLEVEVTRRPQNPREGEAGSIAAPEMAIEGGKMVARGMRSALRRIDYAYETRAETIRTVNPEHPFSGKVRTTLSEKRVTRGEAIHRFKGAKKAAKKLGAKWRRETADVGGYDNVRGLTNRSELIMDGKAKPETDLEKQFKASAQDGQLYLWNKGVEMGLSRVEKEAGGKTVVRPLRARKASITQRLPGSRAKEVYDNHGLREKWFKLLAKLNPNITTEMLRESWTKSPNAKSTLEDVATALEHTRVLENVPHHMEVTDSKGRKETYEMRESDALEVLSHIAERQAAQLASAKTHGQDWSEAQRKDLKDFLAENPGKEYDAAREMAEKPGIATEAEDLISSTRENVKDYGHMGREEFETSVREWVRLAQGEAEGGLWKLMRLSRSIDSVARPAMVVKAPIYDPFEAFTLPALYAGAGRAWKALGKIFMGPNPLHTMEQVRYYERMGAISSKLSSLMWEASKGLMGKWSRFVGSFGEWTERIKGAISAATADVTLESWAAGKTTSRDSGLLAEMRFEPAEQTALLSGKASTELQNKFRNEFVQLSTSRKEAGEGPRAMDNPNITAALRFQRLMSSRTGSVMRRLKIAHEASEKHGVFSEQSAKAWGRWVYQAGTMTSNGMFAKVLGIMVQQILRSDSEEIGPRLQREIIDNFGAALLDSAFKQTVGGPAQTAAQAGGSSTVERAFRQVAPLDQAAGFMRVANAFVFGGESFVPSTLELAKQLHYIPLQGDLSRAWDRYDDWGASVIAGEELSLRGRSIADRDLVWEFLQGPGKEFTLRTQHEKTKLAEFYNGVHRGMAAYWRGAANSDENNEEGWERAMSVFQSVIDDQGEKPASVAGWIRSQRTEARVGKDKMAAFMKYAGAERAREAMQRDLLLSELARKVGKLEGEAAPEWETRVEEFRKLVAIDSGDFGGIVEDAIESAHRSLRLKGDPDLTDWSLIDEIAPIIASTDYATTKVFSGQIGADLIGEKDSAERAYYIAEKLKERAYKRTVRHNKEAALEEYLKNQK